jgi:O-antigen/teichoic acid export membrane protein
VSRIASSTLWNVAGTGAPALAALVGVPLLLHSLGPARFGVLAIAWSVTGYLMLVNLGLGRATIWRLVQARESPDAAASVAWTSLTAHGVLGVFGGALFAMGARPLAEGWLTLGPGLEQEAVGTFYVLALSVPVMLLTLALRSMLEARERFDLVNLVQIPATALNYLGPLLVLPWTRRLDVVVLVILASRVAAMVAHAVQVWGELPEVRAPRRPSLDALRQMLGPGLWMTACVATVPLATLLDRLAIGRFVSAEAVAWYATPYELVSRLWVFSSSLLRAMFPRLTELTGAQASELASLHRRAVRLLLVSLVPVAWVLSVTAGELLRLWLGGGMAAGAPVMQWLCIGIVAGSVAAVPATVLISAGRASWAGLANVAEWPLYLALTFTLTWRWGVAGAGAACAIRAIADAAVMFELGARSLGRVPVTQLSLPASQWALLGLALAIGVGFGRMEPRVAGLISALPGFALLSAWLWTRVLEAPDRALLGGLVRRLRPAQG